MRRSGAARRLQRQAGRHHLIRNAFSRAADGQLAIEHDPVDDWIARADQVPASLSAVVATKIQKRYAAGASLLVYLNIGEYGIRQAELEAAMPPAIAPALPHFDHVWVLWKARLYGPWTA